MTDTSITETDDSGFVGLDEQILAAATGRRASAKAFEAKLKAWSESNDRKFTAETKGDTLELVIMDVIGDFMFGGVTAASVKRELDRHPNAKKIRVLVNSPGGDAFEGIAIRSLLKRNPASVTVEVLGEAQSAGAVIATAGDRVEMHVGSMMMIHRAWTVAIGNEGDMETARNDLRKLDEGQISIFAAKSKQDAGKVKKWLDAETLMTAEEAIERGFADGMAAEAGAPSDAKVKRALAEATPEEFVAATLQAAAEPPKPTFQFSDEEREHIVARRAAALAAEQAARRLSNPFTRAIGSPPPAFGGMRR